MGDPVYIICTSYGESGYGHRFGIFIFAVVKYLVCNLKKYQVGEKDWQNEPGRQTKERERATHRKTNKGRARETDREI